MGRCLRFFAGMGVRVERVMTDNGLAIYRSGEFNVPFESVDIRHVYASCSISDRTVKVGRTSLILTQKWQYARVWDSEAGKATALRVGNTCS